MKYSLKTLLIMAIFCAILITGCESNNDATPPPITPTPTETVTPTYTPTATPPVTITPNPGTPTPTVIPTPPPDIPEDVLFILKHLDNYNLELVELLKQQPWYSDGIDVGERIFINNGLGRGVSYQGVGTLNENDILKEIVANKSYDIKQVQLKGGTKNVLVMYDDETQLEPCMNILVEALPRVENFLSITYPYDTLTAYVRTVQKVQTGGNGSITLNAGFHDPYYVKKAVHELVHAMLMTDDQGHQGGAIEDWINEGLAEFGAWCVLEQINKEKPDFLVRNFSVQEHYDDVLGYLEKAEFLGKVGALDVPIAELHNWNPVETGYYVLKDLSDLMLPTSFSKAIGDFYYFKQDNFYKNKQENLDLVRAADKNDLFNSSLKFAPDKSAVEDFFAARIFGN